MTTSNSETDATDPILEKIKSIEALSSAKAFATGSGSVALISTAYFVWVTVVETGQARKIPQIFAFVYLILGKMGAFITGLVIAGILGFFAVTSLLSFVRLRMEELKDPELKEYLKTNKGFLNGPMKIAVYTMAPICGLLVFLVRVAGGEIERFGLTGGFMFLFAELVVSFLTGMCIGIAVQSNEAFESEPGIEFRKKMQLNSITAIRVAFYFMATLTFAVHIVFSIAKLV